MVSLPSPPLSVSSPLPPDRLSLPPPPPLSVSLPLLPLMVSVLEPPLMVMAVTGLPEMTRLPVSAEPSTTQAPPPVPMLPERVKVLAPWMCISVGPVTLVAMSE